MSTKIKCKCGECKDCIKRAKGAEATRRCRERKKSGEPYHAKPGPKPNSKRKRDGTEEDTLLPFIGSPEEHVKRIKRNMPDKFEGDLLKLEVDGAGLQGYMAFERKQRIDEAQLVVPKLHELEFTCVQRKGQITTQDHKNQMSLLDLSNISKDPSEARRYFYHVYDDRGAIEKSQALHPALQQYMKQKEEDCKKLHQVSTYMFNRTPAEQKVQQETRQPGEPDLKNCIREAMPKLRETYYNKEHKPKETKGAHGGTILQVDECDERIMKVFPEFYEYDRDTLELVRRMKAAGYRDFTWPPAQAQEAEPEAPHDPANDPIEATVEGEPHAWNPFITVKPKQKFTDTKYLEMRQKYGNPKDIRQVSEKDRPFWNEYLKRHTMLTMEKNNQGESGSRLRKK